MTSLGPSRSITAACAAVLVWAATLGAFAMAATANVTLDAGGGHSCALTTAGGVKCWGTNFVGQLGDQSRVDRKTPVDVASLASGVRSIAAGDLHTCALTTAGGVKCWGFNGPGQLGNGDNFDRWEPVDVTGLSSGVAAIAVGDHHGCALTTAGGVKCWGANSGGQLGDGAAPADSNVPVNVTGLASGVTAVTAGFHHTCALTGAGGVKCWGANDQGQLGDASMTARPAPVDVFGLTSGVTAISAGRYHTCALLAGGGLKCWGANWSAKLGDGTASNSVFPLNVMGLSSGVFSVSAGGDHTCALTLIGGAMCWGYNGSGQIGDGGTAIRPTPADVSGMDLGVTAVTAGGDHTCGLLVSGLVRCWGANGGGRRGDGASTDRLSPVPVIGLTADVSSVSAGAAHTCAVASGAARCWGSNWAGQLGDGTVTARSTPAGVSGLTSGVAGIAAGTHHSCSRTVAGAAHCWGQNGFGQIGDSSITTRVMPAAVTGLTTGVSDIVAGAYHSCAVASAGAKCWGRNLYGQLGAGHNDDRFFPVDVTGLTAGVDRLAAGVGHTCALTTGGAVKCWGFGRYGQLGDDATLNSTTAVDVTGLSGGVTAIAAGAHHSCALTTGGGVKCWGHNYMGQLGDTTLLSRKAPVDVDGLTSGVAAIAAGGFETCAILTIGAVRCWGYNGDGQLGDATAVNRLTPTPVDGLGSGYAGIAVGASHACATTTAGAPSCWGHDDDGQLGVGVALNRTPVAVLGLSDVMQPPTVPPGPSPPPDVSKPVKVRPKISIVGRSKRRRGVQRIVLRVSFRAPSAVSPATACRGKVKLRVTASRVRRAASASASLRRKGTLCRAYVRVRLKSSRRARRIKATATFAGNDAVTAFRVRRTLKVR